MKRPAFIALFCVLFIGLHVSHAEEKHLWGNLEKGAYNVGYKVFHEYDYSRTFKSSKDYHGDFVAAETARPVQISVWYPAAADFKPDYMKYKEYIYTIATESDFSANSDTDKDARIQAYIHSAVNIHGREEDIIKLLGSNTSVVKNAPARDGTFPLIIYASSFTSSPAENSLLFEYISSHGYIIAAIPCVGPHSPSMSIDAKGLDAQMRDLEFVLHFMRAYPGVTCDNVGTMGFSWGGFSNVLVSLRNSDIDAVVSLDGAIGSARFKELAATFAYHDPLELRVPFMYLSSSQKREHWFYDGAKYSNRYLLTFPDLTHQNFTSDGILKIIRAGTAFLNRFQDKGVVGAGYEAICKYTLAFFNRYLKNNQKAEEFLVKTPRENDITVNVSDHGFRPAEQAPPTEDQLYAIIVEEGLEAATKIYERFRNDNPDATFINRSFLTGLGYELFDANKYDLGIDVFRFGTIIYPESADSFASLATAYVLLGNNEAALKNYRKALELRPDDSRIQSRIKILESEK